MAKFFKDKTICGFNDETINMTAKEEKNKKVKGKKRGGDRSAVSV